MPKAKDSAPANVVVSGDAVVLDRGGNLVRSYSERVHGKDFGKLARQFAEKHEKEGFTVRG